MLRPRGDYCAIRIRGLPEIRLRKGLILPEGILKALSVTLRGRRLFVNLTYEVELAVLPGSDAAVGIDMGVSDRLALSNGERVGRRRKASKHLARMQRHTRWSLRYCPEAMPIRNCRHRHGRVRQARVVKWRACGGDGARWTEVSTLPACSAGYRNAGRADIAGSRGAPYWRTTSTESAFATAT